MSNREESTSAPLTGAGTAASIIDLMCSDDEDEPAVTKRSGDKRKFSPYLKRLRHNHVRAKVVTPRKKRATASGKDIKIGYKFRKRFRSGWFTGEVIEIRPGAAKRKIYRCRYSDGDEEDLSLMKLQILPEVFDDYDTSGTDQQQLGSRKSPPEDYYRLSVSNAYNAQRQHDDANDDESIFGDSEDSQSQDSSNGQIQMNGTATRSEDVSGILDFTSQQRDTDDREGIPDNVSQQRSALQDSQYDEADDEESRFSVGDEGDDEPQDGSNSQYLNGEASLRDVSSESDDDRSLFSSGEEDGEPQDGIKGGALQDKDWYAPKPPPKSESDDDGSLFSSREEDGEPQDGIKGGALQEKDWYAPKPPPKEEPKRVKKGSTPSTLAEYVTPWVMRRDTNPSYLSVIFKDRICVRETAITDDPPQVVIIEHCMRYEMIYSEYKKGGKGPIIDGVGQPKFKTYYLVVSGPGLDRIDLKSALAGIANFEKLTYEFGPWKVAARFKLLASTACRAPNKKDMLIHDLPRNKFEVIKDINECHQGCGFIPEELLYDLLGRDCIAVSRKFAIQVRIFSPTKFGIAKGMLVIKQGIDKIQIPESMIKVERSSSADPMHAKVVLVITQIFPSENCYTMERFINDDMKNPTDKQKQKLNVLDDDIVFIKNVLIASGVGPVLLDQYFNEFNQWNQHRNHHSTLVGVSDPTGSLPAGCVFLTGMGEKLPQNVFLTRSPCTEGDDGKVVRVACYNDIPKESYNFLANMNFGAVVFSIKGEPLPPKINDSDCDGDRFAAFWDTELLEAIMTNDTRTTELNFLSDENVGYEFEYNGYEAVVIKKLAEEPDTYLVELSKNGCDKETAELTREDIFDGRFSISRVLSHRLMVRNKKSQIEFELQWDSDGSIEWNSLEQIRQMFGRFSNPPDLLLWYVRNNKQEHENMNRDADFKWLKDHLKTLPDPVPVKIVKHRAAKDGTIKVYSCYDDGNDVWEPLDKAKVNSKLLVWEYWYSNQSKLSELPEWDDVSGFWIDEVTDYLVRSSGFDKIIKELSSKYKEAHKVHGVNDQNTLIWGRAFKQSLDIQKHGGKVELPLFFYRQVSKKNQKHLQIA